MKSKFGKAIVVIKDVISSFMSSHLLETSILSTTTLVSKTNFRDKSSVSEKLHYALDKGTKVKQTPCSRRGGGQGITRLRWFLVPFYFKEDMDCVVCHAHDYSIILPGNVRKGWKQNPTFLIWRGGGSKKQAFPLERRDLLNQRSQICRYAHQVLSEAMILILFCFDIGMHKGFQ